jgi:hypothetical protein
MLGARLCLLLLIATLLSPPTARAAEWGSIKGRIIVEGTPAKLDPLTVTKDAFCIASPPPNEKVVIGKDNSLVNAIVYLRLNKNEHIEIHPDYTELLKRPVQLELKGCAFHPHVLLIRVGQTLKVKNADPLGHHASISSLVFSPAIEPGDFEVRVSQASSLPMPLVCNIHPWMIGYTLSLNHPYMAATDTDGRFEIKNIPAGEHEFQFWHETGSLKNIAFAGGKTDARGRAKLKVTSARSLDLGDIKVPARVLK